MTRFADREEARKLRSQGKSYSEIKTSLGIGKGTLSSWLQDMPLTKEQMRNLRDLNPRRIEHFRQTMEKKRAVRLEAAYERARKDIGMLSPRDVFVAGLYLYWGEGMKSGRGNICVANTDPAVILAAMQWMIQLGIPRKSMYIRLHLYRDMNLASETSYWSRVLHLPRSQFRKPYIKDSSLAGLTYKKSYAHGTCNLRFDNVPQWEYIMMAIRHLRELHSARNSMVE